MATPIKLENMSPDEINTYTECEAEILFNDGSNEMWDDIEYKLNGQVRLKDYENNIYETKEQLKAAGIQTVTFYLRADTIKEIHIR